jgi:hypothetical protein
MFKNAGTTFDYSLKRSFGDTFIDHRDDDDMKRGAAYLGPWLLDNPRVQALSSHWITPPLPVLRRVRLHCCVLLRDPVERMLSVYRFERRQQGVDTPGSIRAKQLSFRDYMAWQMQPMPGPVVKNYHVRYCSGEYLGTELELMYQSALQWLCSEPLVGLVHRYDESMVLFEHQLRGCFPQLDLSYIKQNASGEVEQPFAQRRAIVLDELGELREEVLARNDWDITLFERMTARFEQQIAAVPDFPLQLEAFRRRNSEARAAPG